MAQTAKQLKRELERLGDPARAADSRRFFKTGKGEYGEGDAFLGIKVPVQRQMAKKYADLSLRDIQELLDDKFHECRLTALLILAEQYQKGGAKERNAAYRLYLKNTGNINNWDLVDLSAPNIVGCYLLDKSRNILYKLARSKNLWQRRIAVLATFVFIREGDLRDSLKIAEMLLSDRHDLIHKAVGWMLREVGKRDQGVLEEFLAKHAHRMPRTMLRYAIERLPASLKKKVMAAGKL